MLIVEMVGLDGNIICWKVKYIMNPFMVYIELADEERHTECNANALVCLT